MFPISRRKTCYKNVYRLLLYVKSTSNVPGNWGVEFGLCFTTTKNCILFRFNLVITVTWLHLQSQHTTGLVKWRLVRTTENVFGMITVLFIANDQLNQWPTTMSYCFKQNNSSSQLSKHQAWQVLWGENNQMAVPSCCEGILGGCCYFISVWDYIQWCVFFLDTELHGAHQTPCKRRQPSKIYFEPTLIFLWWDESSAKFKAILNCNSGMSVDWCVTLFYPPPTTSCPVLWAVTHQWWSLCVVVFLCW